MLRGLSIIYTLLCKNYTYWFEQNPVIPNINSGANIILYIIWVYKLYLLHYILYTYFKNMLKCNVYYRPDMG